MENRIILVSACLLGIACRYDGTVKPALPLEEIFRGYQLIPFCPESWGGLTAPRPPAEIQNGDGSQVLAGTAKVINKVGIDCTKEFITGACLVLEKARELHPELVILKTNSPSCGVGRIYDGSFSGKLKPGDGVTAALLRQAGFKIYPETEFIPEQPDSGRK